MDDTITRAAEVLIAHIRTSAEACHCGWGRDGTALGKSHAQHVAQALADAGLLVTEEHEAALAATERMRDAEQFVEDYNREALRLHTGTHVDQLVEHAEKWQAEVAAAAKAEALDSAITDVQAIKDDIERGEQP